MLLLLFTMCLLFFDMVPSCGVQNSLIFFVFVVFAVVLFLLFPLLFDMILSCGGQNSLKICVVLLFVLFVCCFSHVFFAF